MRSSARRCAECIRAMTGSRRIPDEVASRRLRMHLLRAATTSRDQLVDCLNLIDPGNFHPVGAEAPMSGADEVHARLEAGTMLGRIAPTPGRYRVRVEGWRIRYVRSS